MRARQAVVTGSAGGIGSAIRAALERDGYAVTGVDLRDAEVTADLSDPAERARAIAEVREACPELDALVVAAGLGGTVQPASTIARVNHSAAVAFLDGTRDLLVAGEGSAVVVGSNSAALAPVDDPLVSALLDGTEDAAAELADGCDGQLVYAVSKLALTRWCRRQVQPWGELGVRLNVVAPGPVETALLRAQLDDPTYGPAVRAFPVPLGRWGGADEIAAAVSFLLSEDAAWIHGVVLPVDGGTDALVHPDRP